MIFGKTFEAQKQKKREKILFRLKNGCSRFAWLPTRLADGRWMWLEKYLAFYRVQDVDSLCQSSSFGLRWNRITKDYTISDAIMMKLKGIPYV